MNSADWAACSSMRHSSSLLCKLVNRLKWHTMRHQDAVFLSALLRAAERATADGLGVRTKVAQGHWLIKVFVGDEAIDAMHLRIPVRRAASDFKLPVQVFVLEPELVDTTSLETWANGIRRVPVRANAELRQKVRTK